jgi:hypothetical protein
VPRSFQPVNKNRPENRCVSAYTISGGGTVMSTIQETLFDLLLNALLQIGFFAIVAVVFSRFVAKARAKHQYCFYLTVLLFCLAAPVIDTFWQSPSTVVDLSSRFPPRLQGRVTFFGTGRQGHSNSIGSSQSHLGSKVGSLAFGGFLFCFGWPASAELFIEFNGCEETHPYSLLPKPG